MRKLKALIKLCLHLLPVHKKTVLFRSFDGMYNDNPRYISEHLHEANPDIKIVWALDTSYEQYVPSYIRVVKIYSSLYFYNLSRSEVVIDNNAGMNGLCGRIQISSFIKMGNRLNISTWHGTPLKKIARDEPDAAKYNDFVRISDYILAGCEYTASILRNAFCDNYPVKLIGTPRNDLLFDKNIDSNALKQKLGLPLNSKIVLFAPTFRNDINNSGINQIQSLDLESLLTTMSENLSGKWCFVYRAHSIVQNTININQLTETNSNQIYNGNIGPDMAEYLICADVLITDYSGSLFDYALTYKPCFLYAPDREHYENVERGFYMNYDSLPFPIAYTSDELIWNIKNFDADIYKRRVEKFLKDIGNVEDGHASERVVDNILEFIKHGVKK